MHEAPISWDFRQQFSGTTAAASGGSTETESVTERICREIDEAKLRFSHIVSPTDVIQDTPPGLEPVPVSCYSGSFMTWSCDNDLAEFEDEIGESGVDDEFVDEECHVEGTLMTEHFCIDTSPDRNTSMHERH